jgi:hypothetical protein
MAARDRRSLVVTLAAGIVLLLAAAVIGGQMLGAHMTGRPLAMLGRLAANAPALGPGRGPANPAPLPSPIPRRPG